MKFDRLRDFLDFYLPMLGVPGSDTSIYIDHQEVFRHTCGFNSMKNRIPLKSDNVYNIYSCTKVSTVISALQLVERGEILLTDPVHIYFPEYKNLTVQRIAADGSVYIEKARKPMLIKHLITMTSGLDYNLNRPAINELIAQKGNACTTREIIKAIASDPLIFEPGEGYCYGLSHDVLGGIVELVSGLTLGEYMRKHIFEPLGMKDTTFNITNLNYGRIASQYDYDSIGRCAMEIPRDQNPFRFSLNYESGGAGLLSTVDDYVLIADALANDGVGKSGQRILSSAGVKLMSMPTLEGKAADDYNLMRHEGFVYCNGVRRMAYPEKAGSLVSKELFGWDGMRMCMCFADPERKLAIFHAEHINGFNGILIPRILNVLYSCLDEE